MSLLLAEELVLLCMDDDTGHCGVPPQDAARGVALALVFELTLRGFLAVEREKLAPQRTTSTGDPLLDLAAQHATALTPTAAVDKLAAEDLLQATLVRLVSRGVLKDAEVWAPGVHLPNDPHPEAAVRDRLRKVLAQAQDPTDHDAALVALLHHLDITTRVLPDEPADVVRTRAENVAARSRPMRDYQQQGSSKKSRWMSRDLMELLGDIVHALN
ncbi:MAG: GPP34 family phosphoprotein [Actinomycetales bacterium]|nr:GPP34 family phosphoprotein [Actinomycetales bacterium]